MDGLKTTEQESVVDIDSLELCSLASTWHQSVCDRISVALVGCARCRSEECVHHSMLVEERFNLYLVLDKLVSGPVEDG